MPKAYLFPGLRYKSLPLRKEIFADRKVQGILRTAAAISGIDVLAACQEKRPFVSTSECFVVTLAVSVAVGRFAVEHIGAPDLLIGHSLGHYPALVMAESLGYEEALRHLQRSGEIYDAYFRGFEYATLLVNNVTIQTIEQLGIGMGEFAVIKHSDGQAVTGYSAELTELRVLIERAGGVVAAVPLRIPFHTELMLYPAAQNADNINRLALRPPRIPLLSSYIAGCLATSAAISSALRKELFSPSRLPAAIQALVDNSYQSVLELSLSGFEEVSLI